MTHNLSFFILVFTLAGLIPALAHGNRPFLTDDGDISELGEFEVQLWTEVAMDPGGEGWPAAPLFHAEIATTQFQGLEFTLGSGLGWDLDGEFTLVNPTIEAKALLLSAEGPRPGIALAIGVHPPLGFGSEFNPGTSVYGLVPVTFADEESPLALHLNLGWAVGYESGFQTGGPLAGLGLEWSPGGGDIAWIADAFAGDPGDPQADWGSSTTTQLGLRWGLSDQVTWDAGVLRSLDGDWMVQSGVVLVFGGTAAP